MYPIARHGLSRDVAIVLSDEELAIQMFEWIGRLPGELGTDALGFLLDETFERFTPDAAEAWLVKHYTGPEANDDDADELLDALNALRTRQAARKLRRAGLERSGRRRPPSWVHVAATRGCRARVLASDQEREL